MIKISNSKSGVTAIDIEGTIGVPEEWQFEEPAGRVATYEKFRRSLAAISKIRDGAIVVNIRSTGGDVGDALLIYDALVSSGARITTRCFGYVASAATIVAQAASDGGREISSDSLYLIHNSVGSCEGNAGDLRQSEELLTKTDERIAGIYARRSGREADDFAMLMGENNGNGRWLSPEEALAAGLADKIIEAEPTAGNRSRRGHTTDPKIPANVANIDLMRYRQDVENDKLRTKIAALEFENAQLKIRPTEIKAVEDPSLGECRLSANDIAYMKDAQTFLRR